MRPGCQAHSSLPLGEGDRMQRPLQQGDIRGTRSALRPVLEATAHSARSCRPRPPGAPGGPLALHTAPFPALVRGPAGHMASLLEAGGLERCLQERHVTCSRNWLSADCSASYTLPSVVTFGSTESPGSASGSWSCLTSPTPAKVLTWWPVAPGPAPSIHYPASSDTHSHDPGGRRWRPEPARGARTRPRGWGKTQTAALAMPEGLAVPGAGRRRCGDLRGDGRSPVAASSTFPLSVAIATPPD